MHIVKYVSSCFDYYQVVVKGYHECSFAVEVGERFVAQKKKGDAEMR